MVVVDDLGGVNGDAPQAQLARQSKLVAMDLLAIAEAGACYTTSCELAITA